MSRQATREKHIARVRDEVASYLEEAEVSANMDMKRYIDAQVQMIIAGMYSTKKRDEHPDHWKNDPDTVDADYYRESIDAYGTVFRDFPI